MTYVRNGTRSAIDALRVRQQIEAAEVERAEKELAEIQGIEIELERIRRRREHVSESLRNARKRTDTARAHIRMPEPVYGGRAGLAAAVKEISTHQWQTDLMARRTRKEDPHGTNTDDQAGLLPL